VPPWAIDPPGDGVPPWAVVHPERRAAEATIPSNVFASLTAFLS